MPLNCSLIGAKMRIRDESFHCSDGLVSRAGWALVNDTGRPLLDAGWWGPARDASQPPTEDLYLFGHGHRYKAALADFAAVAGRVPMLPRYMLGVMYTRWYDFNAGDLHDIADAFER